MAELEKWVIYPDAAEKVTDTPECQSLLYSIAQDALNEAYSRAPVWSGHYRDSLAAFGREGSEEKVPFAKLGSSSSFWHFVEYGALDTPAYHVLEESVRPLVEVYVVL